MTISKVFRVKSIEGLGMMKPFSVLSLGMEQVWEVVPKNMAALEIKFVDESGNETQTYFVRPVKKLFQTGV